MNETERNKFLALCREHGLKGTSQRLAVYDCVRSNHTHPNVDEVWAHCRKSVPRITRESVYRILNEFSDLGLLNRIDHIVRARYDIRTGPHGHYICERCDKIVDFDLSDEAAPHVRAFAGEVRQVELRITGVCDECCGKTSKSNNKTTTTKGKKA